MVSDQLVTENSEVQYRSHSDAYATHILSVGGTATDDL